jgi:hypothetical protein
MDFVQEYKVVGEHCNNDEGDLRGLLEWLQKKM